MTMADVDAELSLLLPLNTALRLDEVKNIIKGNGTMGLAAG